MQQERLELTQHQREALQGVRKAVLEVLSGLLSQRTELTTQLQVRHVQLPLISTFK